MEDGTNDSADDARAPISERILAWVGEQPSWIALALRAVIDGRDADADEIGIIADAACSQEKTDASNDKEAITKDLSIDDLIGLDFAGAETLIKSIENIESVGCVGDESSIDFSIDGLTIFYGENGSGKSTYSRLLRNTCTSRAGRASILPDVFSQAPANTSHATFRFIRNGRVETREWTSAMQESILFPEVLYFDGECGQVELTKENDIVYNPPVLEVLQRLGAVVDAVARRIKQRSDEIGLQMQRIDVPGDYKVTYEKLGIDSADTLATLQDRLSSASLTDADEEKINELIRDLANQPEIEKRKLEREREVLTSFKESLGQLYRTCNTSIVKSLVDAQKQVSAAKDAAKLARTKLESRTALDGVGTDVWISLWEAARKYSNAYCEPDGEFPNYADGARCPLCQQVLGDDAKTRFKSFDEYLKSATEAALRTAERREKRLIDDFISARESLMRKEILLDALDDDGLRDLAESLISSLKADGVDTTADCMTRTCALVTEVGLRFHDAIAGVDGKLESLQRGNIAELTDAKKRELDGLRARKWILSYKKGIETNFQLSAEQRRLQGVLKRCNTREITSLVSTLSETEVIEKLRSSFSREVNALLPGDERIELRTSANKGRESQKITLSCASKGIAARSVFSEGEQKALALAGFFANLDTLPNMSSVVFDDPVNSLDHVFRNRVIDRIAAEATRRPVVLFTHDPTFTVSLLATARENSVQTVSYQIKKVGNRAGVIDKTLDWESSSTQQRIKLLHSKAQELRSIWKNEPDRYRGEVGNAYSFLRAAVERSVEELLLAGVVQRYQPDIHTKKLRLLTDICSEDVDEFEKLMSRASKETPAHDTPLGPLPAAPTPDEFESDVDAFYNLVCVLEKRRKHK